MKRNILTHTESSHRLIICLLCLSVLISGCRYPVTVIRPLDKSSLGTSDSIRASTKVHLIDGSVIRCENGIATDTDRSVSGTGIRYSLTRNDSITANWKVPFDSIAGLEYYENSSSKDRSAGEGVLTAVAILSPLIFLIVFTAPPHPN